MKNKFLHLTFFSLALLTTIGSFSQSKKFFAVTGEQFGSVNWITFRQADLDGESSLKTVYIPAEKNEAVYDALTGKQLITNDADAVVAAPESTPQTCGCLNKRMVAAIAYDVKSNRLYYTSMMGNQLRYLDLNGTQVKSYTVTTQLLKNFPNQPGEASVITRMSIASDGYGYALTNDNEHLIRFSTGGKQTAITDLGRLVDAKSNGENSVKTQFKSWGGDLIADASGNLYLFTMQRDVYKINPKTRLATYLGQIKNIPEDYSVNAAMVEDGANVIVGSSTKTTNYYRVSLNTLEAEAITSKAEQVYNVSDFTNANFAFGKKDNLSAVANTLRSNVVNIYPNPAMGGKVNIQFGNFTTGKYLVQISEMQGKAVLQKELKISGSQTESITVNSISAGTYLLRVLNEKGKSVYTNNVIISK